MPAMLSSTSPFAARRSRALLASLALGMLASCEADPAPAIMIALNTDMLLPDDVSHVGLRITSEDDERLGQVIFEDVRPTFDASNGRYVSFPATLAVLPGEREAPRVRIRVVAFRAPIVDGVAVDAEAEAIVLRNVVTTIPLDRVALLQIPILFASQGGASGTLASVNATDLATVRSTCAVQEQSNIAGRCVDATIDSSSLPDYTGMASVDGGRCFPVAACFAGPVRIAVDTSDCSAAAPAAEAFNLGFERVVPSAESDPQFCVDDGVEARCFVPIAAESEYGWQRSGERIVFAPGVCTQLAEGNADAIAGSSACAPKPLEVSPCGPWNPTTGEVEIVDPDGGLDGAGGGGGGGGGGTPADPRFGAPQPLSGAAPSSAGTLALGALTGDEALRIFHGSDLLGFERCNPEGCTPFTIDGTLPPRFDPQVRVAVASSAGYVFLADRAGQAQRISLTGPPAPIETLSSVAGSNPLLAPAYAVARTPAIDPVPEHVWVSADVDEGVGGVPRLFYMAPGQAGATAQGGQNLDVLATLSIDLADASYQALAGTSFNQEPALVLASGPHLLRCQVGDPQSLFTSPDCVATTAPTGWVYTHVAPTLPLGSVAALRTQTASSAYELVVTDFSGGAPSVITSSGPNIDVDLVGIDLASDSCFDYAIIREQARVVVRAFRISDRLDTADVLEVDVTANPPLPIPVTLGLSAQGLYVGFLSSPAGSGGVAYVRKNFDPATCDPLP